MNHILATINLGYRYSDGWVITAEIECSFLTRKWWYGGGDYVWYINIRK